MAKYEPLRLFDPARMRATIDAYVEEELNRLASEMRGVHPTQVIIDEASSSWPEWGGAMARVKLNVGDKLLTPYGIARVLGFDHPRDGVITDKGNWGFEEIEDMPRPNPSEIEAVELWLELAGRIIPKHDFVSENVKCKCGCEHCTSMEVRAAGTRQLVESQHFANNTVCKCRQFMCPCV